MVKDAFDARMDADYGAGFDEGTTDPGAMHAGMKTFISNTKAWIEAHRGG